MENISDGNNNINVEDSQNVDINVQPTIPTRQPYSAIQDPNGDISSGRIIKMRAMTVAIIIACVGLLLAGIGLFISIHTAIVITSSISIGGTNTFINGAQFIQLVLGLVGIFCGVAVGAEGIQKFTKL
jgi:hypothetical protein